jgi:hypothetical protein
MRQPRLKPVDRDVYYHAYNRVAGDPSDRPFDDREKEEFIRTEIMTAARGTEHMAKRRCALAVEESLAGLRLVCYRRLRA